MQPTELIPIRNFAVVDEAKGIYRSAQPMYDYEYKFLKNLGIDMIINLRKESDHDKEYAPRYEMEVRKFDVVDHKPPTMQQANDFIACIKAAMQLGIKVLFHCEHGRGRTSTFCVLVRLAMGWNLQDAINEQKEVFGYEFQHKDQLEFLKDNFSTQNKI